MGYLILRNKLADSILRQPVYKRSTLLDGKHFERLVNTWLGCCGLFFLLHIYYFL